VALDLWHSHSENRPVKLPKVARSLQEQQDTPLPQPGWPANFQDFQDG